MLKYATTSKLMSSPFIKSYLPDLRAWTAKGRAPARIKQLIANMAAVPTDSIVCERGVNMTGMFTKRSNTTLSSTMVHQLTKLRANQSQPDQNEAVQEYNELPDGKKNKMKAEMRKKTVAAKMGTPVRMKESEELRLRMAGNSEGLMLLKVKRVRARGAKAGKDRENAAAHAEKNMERDLDDELDDEALLEKSEKAKVAGSGFEVASEADLKEGIEGANTIDVPRPLRGYIDLDAMPKGFLKEDLLEELQLHFPHALNDPSLKRKRNGDLDITKKRAAEIFKEFKGEEDGRYLFKRKRPEKEVVQFAPATAPLTDMEPVGAETTENEGPPGMEQWGGGVGESAV